MTRGNQPTRQEVFRDALLLLLRAGPMKVEELHPIIKARYPEWCDDDDVIVLEYQTREPKWQRAVRAALDKLKLDGLVDKEPRRNGHWYLK